MDKVTTTHSAAWVGVRLLVETPRAADGKRRDKQVDKDGDIPWYMLDKRRG